jgi:hypothetical protein
MEYVEDSLEFGSKVVLRAGCPGRVMDESESSRRDQGGGKFYNLNGNIVARVDCGHVIQQL